MPGACFKQLGGQWLLQEGRHVQTLQAALFLFTAEGGLMPREGGYGLFELTLLYFSCQMGWLCQIAAPSIGPEFHKL